jgi:hypothetical protein
MRFRGKLSPRTAGDVRFDGGKFLASLGRWLVDWGGSVQRHGERLSFEGVPLPRIKALFDLAGEVTVESAREPVRVRYSLDLKGPILWVGAMVIVSALYETWRNPEMGIFPALILGAGFGIVFVVLPLTVFLLWFRRAIRRIAWDSTDRPD